MKKKLQIAVGLFVGLGLFWLMFRHTDWARVYTDAKQASLGWLLVAVGLIFLSFLTRIQRWKYVVRTAGPVSFRHMFSATQIGFLVNFVLPGRIGEAVRAAALSRLAGIPFSKCLAMVALDRVNDLIGLVAVILFTAFVYFPDQGVVLPASTFGQEFSFSAQMIRNGEILMVAGLVVTIGLLVGLYAKRELALKCSDSVLGLVSRKLAGHVHGFLDHFAQGLRVFRSARDLLLAVGWSLVTWTIFLFILAASLKAFHIQAPWYTVLVMQTLLAICISVPGAPGFVGQFHAPIVATLIMLSPGIEDSKAKAFALVVHLLNLVTIAATGVACLVAEGVGLTELRQESKEAAASATK